MPRSTLEDDRRACLTNHRFRGEGLERLSLPGLGVSPYAWRRPVMATGHHLGHTHTDFEVAQRHHRMEVDRGRRRKGDWLLVAVENLAPRPAAHYETRRLRHKERNASEYVSTIFSHNRIHGQV